MSIHKYKQRSPHIKCIFCAFDCYNTMFKLSLALKFRYEVWSLGSSSVDNRTEYTVAAVLFPMELINFQNIENKFFVADSCRCVTIFYSAVPPMNWLQLKPPNLLCPVLGGSY